jgi:hypothetical protein
MKCLLPCALLLVCFFSAHAVAACNPDKEESTPTSRFILNGGEAHDRQTGLIWRRCAIGATWRANRCVGTARLMTLTDAGKVARQAGEDWRVPTVEELYSLVERRCRYPAINAAVFPDVRELYEGKAKYWSVSSVKDLPQLFYNIDFLDGGIDANTRGITMGVRPVRNAR